MKNFFLIFLSLLCVACCVQRQVAPQENTRVEVRTETVFQKDTIYLELPSLLKKFRPLTPAPYWRTSTPNPRLAYQMESFAHSLATKPVNEPVLIDKQTVYRDSLVFVDKIITNTVEVEKPIPSGDRFFLGFGKWVFVILLGFGLWKSYRFLCITTRK